MLRQGRRDDKRARTAGNGSRFWVASCRDRGYVALGSSTRTWRFLRTDLASRCRRASGCSCGISPGPGNSLRGTCVVASESRVTTRILRSGRGALRVPRRPPMSVLLPGQARRSVEPVSKRCVRRHGSCELGGLQSVHRQDRIRWCVSRTDELAASSHISSEIVPLAVSSVRRDSEILMVIAWIRARFTRREQRAAGRADTRSSVSELARWS